MGIGEKIKKRREELGYTQEELAKKMGYKSRSSINKIEVGINDVAQSKIVEFAKILKTTPAYLMGWEKHDTETKKSERDLMIEKYQLTSEELAEYDRIMKLSIEMNTLMFQSNNIELETADKEEMDYELSETLKKAFISSLITKRKKEKKE